MIAVDEVHGAAGERCTLIIGEFIALQTIGTGNRHAFRGRCLGCCAGLFDGAHGVMCQAFHSGEWIATWDMNSERSLLSTIDKAHAAALAM
jgi:hypothetical protein